TFTLVVNVSPSTASGTVISNTATVSTATTDSNTANNSATTSTTVQSQLDFGDAPASYGTTIAGNGARHTISSSLHLGATIDFENEGQASAAANGDDLLGIDDEDGVVMPGGLIAGRDAVVTVNSSGTGKLDAWIDFNRNGVFDTDERIADSLLVGAGARRIHS